jgi:signal transduction histidine kinase
MITSWLRRLWERLPRPLDPLRSIKLKLAVLVAASCGVTALIVDEGLRAGYAARYTLPFAVLVSLVVSQVLAHGMTSPLREMTTAARAIAHGDYGRGIRASSRDEVGELARAWTRMAAELADADRRQREFVANVSHELRTPISALHALLENLADGVTPAQPEVMRTALDQTARLGRLIAQLLDLSRMDSGADPLDRAEFDAAPFLSAIATQTRIGHPATRFRIEVDDGLSVHGDRDRLHQVVSNLLDNAAVHGPPDGTVTVTARSLTPSGGLLLEVSDQGPGIPLHHRPQVFERFSRGSAAHDADGGTGLGLAIARWAVELHGGDISITDSPHGCCIRVAIPSS